MAEHSAPRSQGLHPRDGASAAASGAAAAQPADLAALLARQIAALAETTGASRVVAWGRGPDGAPSVLAARVEGAELRPPSEAAWRALAALPGPTDLAGASDPELVKLAGEYGFLAAAPLRSDDGEALAVLLLGTDGPLEPARPRLLAALASAVAKSLRPAAAAAALERLVRLDGEVQRIDRLVAVGGLLAEIVHEIRNPLVSIKTFLHLLGEDGGGDPSEFREVAIEELRRIERLLEAVSQHARPPSAPSAEAFAEVEPAVRSVAQLATLRAVVRRVEVETALSGPLAPVRIAGDSLRQVLLNLALNAIEAAPEAGRVRIAAAQQGGRVEIAVEDDGPGVPEALRERVFEPFFSTKSKPGGLGLAITKRLVEDAGGSIEVEGRAPSGSRFCVRLPVAR
jgi:signal transduction histidine kinase